MIRTAVGVVLLTSILVSAAAAQDALPAHVQVTLPDCPEAMDDARLEELLRVELTGDGVQRVERATDAADGSGDAPLARITVRAETCEPGAAEFVITIDDAATQKVVRRAVSLTEVEQDARTRALSLSVVELLRASWAELAMPDAPPPAVEVPLPVREAVAVRAREPADEPLPDEELGTPATPVVAVPAGPRRRVRVEGAALARSFPGSSSATIGGRVGVSVPLAGSVRLHVDGEASTGQSLDRLGTVDLTLVGGGVGLSVEVVADPLTLDVAARAVVGRGSTSGNPYDPSTTSGDGADAVLIVGGEATLYAELIEGVEALLGVEVGGAAIGVDALADGRAVAGLSGAALAARIGVAWSR